MPKDLRYFLNSLARSSPSLFVRVTKQVSPEYQISAIVNKLGGGLTNHGRVDTPALLFENVKGSEMPVLTNLFSCRKLLALAMETSEDSITQTYVNAWKTPIPPTHVKGGPVKDVVSIGTDADLNKLPVVTHCEKDVGAFITPGVTLIKDPVSGYVNAGIYRQMRKGRNKMGISLAPENHASHMFRAKEAKKEDLEFATVLGYHPALHLAAEYNGEFGVSELDIAGALLREPVPMVKCETVDLEVPAFAEIVIEGRIKAGVREADAPFGEYLGYYGDEQIKRPVVEVTAITHRKDAIFHDLHNGGVEHPLLFSVGIEAELYRRVKQTVPQLTAVRVPMSGVCHLGYVQIKKGYEGSGKNAAIAALTTPYIKIAVVVDDDIDIDDEGKIIWAIVTRTDPDRSFFTIPETSVSRLDPRSYSSRSRSERGVLSTKLGIDATKSIELGFSEVALPPIDLMQKINLADYVGNLTGG